MLELFTKLPYINADVVEFLENGVKINVSRFKEDQILTEVNEGLVVVKANKKVKIKGTGEKRTYAYTGVFEIPGVTKENFKKSYKDGVLTITTKGG
jgi:HSP20 family molecular chaperone IbpA